MKHTLAIICMEQGTVGELLNALDTEMARFDTHCDIERARIGQVMESLCQYHHECRRCTEELLVRWLERHVPRIGRRIRERLTESEQMVRVMRKVAERFLSGDAISDASVRRGIRRFTSTYRERLQIERELLLPAINASLSEEEWEMIDLEALDLEDPDAGDAEERHYRTMIDAMREMKRPCHGLHVEGARRGARVAARRKRARLP